jgi:hypothetical protein
MPAGWMPAGFVPWPGPTIYGASSQPPVNALPDRPYLPCDQFQFEQESDAAAWRVTDALLGRARQA